MSETRYISPTWDRRDVAGDVRAIAVRTYRCRSDTWSGKWGDVDFAVEQYSKQHARLSGRRAARIEADDRWNPVNVSWIGAKICRPNSFCTVLSHQSSHEGKETGSHNMASASLTSNQNFAPQAPHRTPADLAALPLCAHEEWAPWPYC